MKIAFDATTILDQYGLRGIGRCSREILTQLLLHTITGKDNIEVAVYSFKSFGDLLAELPLSAVQKQLINKSKNIEFFSLGEVVSSSPIKNILLYLKKIRPLLKKINPDVVFMPYFERIVPSNWPTVVLVHDAIPLRTGKFSGKGIFINFFKKLYYRWAWDRQQLASQLVAVSRSTKLDVQNFGLNPDKISVVYNGISDIFFETNESSEITSTASKYDTQRDEFFIYDSGLEANKRPSLLLDVFKEFLGKFPHLKLLVTGRSFNRKGEPRNEVASEFLAEIKKRELEGKIIFSDGVTENDLCLLMAGAKAYINMSGDEGFGFGPLQAMALGTPAIISTDNAAFIELSSKHALLIDPESLVTSCRSAVASLQSMTTAKNIEAQKYAQTFTWQENFRQLLPIIIASARGK